MEKLSAMAVFHKTMEEFLYLLDFGEEGDLMRRGGSLCTADSVSLDDAPWFKGLEFPAVILYGVRKNSIPLEYFKNRKSGSGREEDPEAGLQEERRLFLCGHDQSEGGAGPSDLRGAVCIPFRAAGRGSFAGNGTGTGGDGDEAAEFV